MADIEGSNGQRTEFRAVGRANVPGRLSYTIATGRAKYGTDAVMPGMLHAKFLRCPYGRARVKGMDTRRARALEGVVDIVTWDDPEVLAVNPGLTHPPVNTMAGIHGPLIPGEAETEDEEIGAVVVAVTPEICEEALRLIEVQWEVLPSIVDARDGLKPGAPVIRHDPKKLLSNYTTGDMESGFREADHIVDFDWGHSRTASHIPNPNGSLAWWAQDPWGSEGRTLYIEGVCPTWGAFQLLPLYNIGFDKLYRLTLFQGGKYCDWIIRRSQLITPLLARRTGRPVRCVNDRRNDYYVANPQRYCHVKMGFRKDGTITAVEESTIGDQGAPEETASAWGAFEARFSPFNTTRCVHQKSLFQEVYTNSGRNTLSQTSPFNWDVMTIAEQIVAEKLGMDVIDVALKNVHGPSSQQDPGIPPGLRMCVEKGKKAMDWKWHPAGTRKLPDGRLHGLAFRYALSPRHAQQPYTATVTIQADNKVYIPLKGPWAGIYSADAAALVVAEELGAKVEDVILLYDEKAIFTPCGGGSDGSTASSWVMKEAAVKCRKLLLDQAARSRVFNTSPENLDTRDTMVFLKQDPGKAYPFGKFIADEGFGDHDLDITATFFGRPPETTWAKSGHILDVMNTSYCEVAVDTETGGVEVTKFVVVCDPGKVLRLTSFEGQLHQAMFLSQGGLSEEFIYDKDTGVKLSTNMFEYKKPTILDLGPIDTYAVETRSGNACYGASGISHCMAAPLLPVCAVANAIGHWIEPPATPDRILKALGKV
ncbi:MAG: xanthine dehydrogenase family protein molybdopterin-binding subunit [Acidobacteria bacterium]|nr:xanthine dehydrogenase family protein molybdopterin-binding subunit [Acidobacteriota bacterium]